MSGSTAQDRQSLVEVLNFWPELVGMPPVELQIWTMLYHQMPEWVPAVELSQAIYGRGKPVHMQVMQLRRFLTGKP
jgi:hypothetical protein